MSTTHIWLLHHIWLLRHIWLLHHIKCDVRAILAGKTQYNFIFSLLFAISDVRMCKISCIQRMFFHSLKELFGIITKNYLESSRRCGRCAVRKEIERKIILRCCHCMKGGAETMPAFSSSSSAFSQERPVVGWYVQLGWKSPQFSPTPRDFQELSFVKRCPVQHHSLAH